MDHVSVPPRARALRVLLAVSLALGMLAIAPSNARAHDSCAIARPAATGFVASVLSTVNVFSSFVETSSAPCGDKYGEVDVQLTRDWGQDDTAEQSSPPDAFSPGTTAASTSNAPSTHAPCRQGMAADFFPCDGIDMLSHVSHAELGTTFVNDIWGWTDARTRKDYALVGASNGTVFVDISDPKRPDVLGILPTASTSGGSSWRDIKVYEDHAFVVSEHRNHGVQVFDLTRLRDWDGTYTTYDMDAHYTQHGSAHNININTDTGYAYSVGAGSYQGVPAVCGSGLHMIDINDPKNPEFAGCFQDHGYVHDTQCVVYDGPDADFRGREICVNSNGIQYRLNGENYLSIVDVTDKANPVALARVPYGGSGYSHQGWLTEDQGYFLHGDEGDEILAGINSTTRVWDLTDLTDPFVSEEFVNDTTSIDHNLYTQGDYAYASNYTTGLRVYDVSDVADGEIEEVAYFDVYPDNDNASFEGGTWSNYPYFRQKGIVAVSSIDRGLFILQPRVGRNGG